MYIIFVCFFRNEFSNQQQAILHVIETLAEVSASIYEPEGFILHVSSCNFLDEHIDGNVGTILWAIGSAGLKPEVKKKNQLIF